MNSLPTCRTLTRDLPRLLALVAIVQAPLLARAATVAHETHGHTPAPVEASAAHAAHSGHPPSTGMAHDHAAAGAAHPGHDATLAVPGMLHPARVPMLTDADREAAFPALQGHTTHDKYLGSFLLFDRLEYQDANDGSTLAWAVDGWLGGDVDRLWLRSEGERTNGVTDEAELQLLWGHAISPWWEAVAGVRQDFKPGPAQTWVAAGIQGMPLYGLETELTAYLGEGGQTAARLEAEYDLLLTQRLILQPTVEANLYGRNDPARGVGAGLATTEAGLRLRYEITREFAPYLGVSWQRAYGNTAERARDEGEDRGETRLVLGVRLWF